LSMNAETHPLPRLCENSWTGAPKARHVIAQGNALGDAPLISGKR
jgi:hypothetical protein